MGANAQMTRFFKDVNISLFILCNITGCLLLYGLQFVRYAFLTEKKGAAL